MPSLRTLVIAGAATLVVGLAAAFPARLAWQWVEPPGVAFAGDLDGRFKAVDVGTFPEARRAFQVTRCNQCVDAPCVNACPTSAMHTRPDGIVDFDKDGDEDVIGSVRSAALTPPPPPPARFPMERSRTTTAR